jgi:hypothetical protein
MIMKTSVSAVLALSALALAGCAQARSAASGAPASTAPASTAPIVTTAQACKDLAHWENGSGIGNLAFNSVHTKIEQESSGSKFGTDFRSWMHAILTGHTSNSASGKVTADCTAAGVPDVMNGGAPVSGQSSTPSPRPRPRPARQTVTFVVTGTPGADVTYGPAGTNLSGSVPMRVTEPLGSPSYYAINAQLQGGGQVECKIKVDGKTISASQASGGYNIAQCEISPDPLTGEWQNDN